MSEASTPRAISDIDAAAFRADLDALRARVKASLGPADLRHLRVMQGAGRALTIAGFATAWIAVNPFSVIAIALGLMARWMVAHHVAHGGYEKVPGVPERYTRKRFAMGARRYLDWFDWIDPEAWLYEHNQLHHYHTSELTDPDLVDRNLAFLRDLRAPRFVKYVAIVLGALTWKLIYYAPNVLNGLAAKDRHEKGAPHAFFISPWNVFDLREPLVRRLWLRNVLPYAVFQFAIVPALFLPLGTGAALAVLGNRVLAELLTNLHTFVIIVPSHAGEDLFAFESASTGRQDFYLRQALCTANYRTGGVVNDFLHMWINYQLEHHLFPDLPMSTYRDIQPEVAAICRKHGVPYVQQSVWKRLAKLVDLCVGKADMPRVVPVPALAGSSLARDSG